MTVTTALSPRHRVLVELSGSETHFGDMLVDETLGTNLVDPIDAAAASSSHIYEEQLPVCGFVEFSTRTLILSGVALSALCTFGLIGNTVAGLILIRRFLQKSIFKHFVIALCVSDTGILASALIMLVLPRFVEGYMTVEDRLASLTVILYPVACICQTASAWLTTAMTLLRYASLRAPLRARRYLASDTARGTIALVWLGSALYNIPRVLEVRSAPCYNFRYNATSLQLTQTELRQSLAYKVAFLSFASNAVDYVIPFIVLLGFNGSIAVQVWAHRDSSGCREGSAADAHGSGGMTKSMSACGGLRKHTFRFRRRSSGNYGGGGSGSGSLEGGRVLSSSVGSASNGALHRTTPPRHQVDGAGQRDSAIQSGSDPTPLPLVTKLLMFVTLMFLACRIPPFATNILEVAFDYTRDARVYRAYSVTADVSNLVVCLNASCNFLAYLAFNTAFRQRCWSALRGGFGLRSKLHILRSSYVAGDKTPGNKTDGAGPHNHSSNNNMYRSFRLRQASASVRNGATLGVDGHKERHAHKNGETGDIYRQGLYRPGVGIRRGGSFRYGPNHRFTERYQRQYQRVTFAEQQDIVIPVGVVIGGNDDHIMKAYY